LFTSSAASVITCIELQKAAELFFDALEIFLQYVLAKQVPFRTFSAWIAHHAGSAAYKGHRLMAGTLQVHQQ
jgi:hypothetical protein